MLFQSPRLVAGVAELSRQRRRREIFVESRPKWKPKLRRSGLVLMMSPLTGLRIMPPDSAPQRTNAGIALLFQSTRLVAAVDELGSLAFLRAPSV